MLHHKQSSELGFSLMELLYIILIIGILSTLAISTYKGFKQSSFENTVRHDIRNAALACESYYAEHQSYPVFGPFTGTKNNQNFTFAPSYTLTISEGVTIHSVRQSDQSLDIIGTHPGTSQGFQYTRHLSL